jgi:carbonic anhydrase
MIRISRLLISVIALSASLQASAVAATMDDAAVKIKWGYRGNIAPTHWGQLDPQFAVCSTGKEQTPIDIPSKTLKTVNNLTIQYQPAELHIIEDGVTDLMIGKQHTLFLDGHSVQLNFPKNGTQEIVKFNGDTYHLVQFHFHTPSETQINGRAFPLEIHFVHQGEDGKALVIAILASAGKDNKTLQEIITHLPSEIGVEKIIGAEKINPQDLIPIKHNAYYAFAGSLTTPPCAQGVQWVVLADTIPASPAQILSMRKAAGGANARPIQPIHDRKISYTKE